jgi:hypothetical protein
MAKKQKTVETLTHGEASRKNIPTAEYQSVYFVYEPSKTACSGGARFGRVLIFCQ